MAVSVKGHRWMMIEPLVASFIAMCAILTTSILTSKLLVTVETTVLILEFGLSFSCISIVSSSSGNDPAEVHQFMTIIIIINLTLYGMVAYFCHHSSDNYVDLSYLYADLSDIYVKLSDHNVDLSEKYHHN